MYVSPKLFKLGLAATVLLIIAVRYFPRRRGPVIKWKAASPKWKDLPKCKSRTPACGRSFIMSDCKGNHAEIAREFLGNRCYDLNVKMFIDEKNAASAYGPGQGWCGLVNTFTAGGKNVSDFFVAEPDAERLHDDATYYDVAFVPGWPFKRRWLEYKKQNLLHFDGPGRRRCAVVLGPNISRTKLRRFSNLWHSNCAKIVLSASGWMSEQLATKHNATFRGHFIGPHSYGVASLPQGIDTELVSPKKQCEGKRAHKLKAKVSPDRCLIYYKATHNREAVETTFQVVTKALDKLGVTCSLVTYRSYKKEDYMYVRTYVARGRWSARGDYIIMHFPSAARLSLSLSLFVSTIRFSVAA
eukprot:GHVU01197468.1.p1 GENE.GHVU01197468.1~~GHVU01197468.1.p1  ORF type:complete len:356 (+),score=16.57 GHVU01197468.1:106-1173(+)